MLSGILSANLLANAATSATSPKICLGPNCRTTCPFTTQLNSPEMTCKCYQSAQNVGRLTALLHSPKMLSNAICQPLQPWSARLAPPAWSKLLLCVAAECTVMCDKVLNGRNRHHLITKLQLLLPHPNTASTRLHMAALQASICSIVFLSTMD